MNLAAALEHAARNFPEREAIAFQELRLNFSLLNTLANQAAAGLRGLGLSAGEKVALSCPNIPWFPVLYYGILKAGGVVVPLSILLKEEEVAAQLQDSDAVCYLCFADTETLPLASTGYAAFRQAPGVRHFVYIPPPSEKESPFPDTLSLGELLEERPDTFDTVQTAADDTAVIVYTSGTTGRPKGAELSHSNLGWNAHLAQGLFQLGVEDRVLTVLPLFHIFGQSCLMNTMVMGGVANVLLPRFDAEQVLQTMAREGISIFAGVPTMYWALLQCTDEALIDAARQRLRLCVSGGGALPVQLAEDFEQRFAQPIYEGYGLSESSPVIAFNAPPAPPRIGSIGRPLWGVEVRIADPQGNPVPAGQRGELLCRGHNVMKGYYKNPEASTQALRGGWLHTGDVAECDEEGRLYIVDRIKDLIIRGGRNIYPRELEELMTQHEAVSLVAVVGVPDSKYGEEIKAFVVLKEGCDIGTEELQQWTRERVAAYKYPRLIEFRQSLPMSATGKILKRELRDVPAS